MNLTTTHINGSSRNEQAFSNLCYLHGPSQTVLLETSLENKSSAVRFFMALSRFVLTADVRQGHARDIWYQFALRDENKLIPIKWFTLHLDDGTQVFHDIAFNTTLIEVNGLTVPFGKFPFSETRRYARYREFKLKARAYKFIANTIRKKL